MVRRRFGGFPRLRDPTGEFVYGVLLGLVGASHRELAR